MLKIKFYKILPYTSSSKKKNPGKFRVLQRLLLRAYLFDHAVPLADGKESKLKMIHHRVKAGRQTIPIASVCANKISKFQQNSD